MHSPENIKDFCGKPIIAYSIEAAVSAGCFDEVMVSTDSGEIAELSKSYGATVPFLRRAETSNDHRQLLTGDKRCGTTSLKKTLIAMTPCPPC